MERIQIFKYRIVSEEPLERLREYPWNNNWRLQMFAKKGCTCVSCGKVGTRLVQGRDNAGGLHWDVYTDDLYPITVDHIIPKSNGGAPYDRDNLQPMCSGCNSDKADRGEGEFSSKPRRNPVKVDLTGYRRPRKDEVVGMEVWRSRGRKAPRHLGVVSRVVKNPHTGRPAVVIGDNHVSLHHVDTLYVKAA